ncbi:SH3 domain-containing protein [Butyrivibrio sp. AE3004]|uniref:SH3 domain-containing protein n=1 Tax=Butyrivibrio sp. AE3004 TaxID=1506994 RepID=UPI000493C572|nr:SH3 domain-containing protein [Butyrivibrio sp. AE3004]
MNFKGMNFNKKNNEPENPFAAQDKRTFWEFITDNKKIVMPIILVVAVALTVVIALNANNRTISTDTQDGQVTVDENGSYIVPEVDLEKNAYEAINDLMSKYFTAYASGDMETIKSIYTGLESTEELRLKEVSKYINQIPTVDVYTKPGPVDGSYVAYAYTEVLFQGYDTPLPGMQTMYVCTDENGNLYINGDVVDDKITEYISNISLQADVVDLNNSVAANYNDIIAGNEGLAQFLSDMSASIQVSVGEALAAIESGETVVPDATAENPEAAEGENGEQPAEGEVTEQPAEGEATEQSAEGENGEQPAEEAQTAVVTKIKATDVVNIRSSDSETADKIGKTEIDQVFTRIAALENGWSKIEYNGGEAFVKSEYFTEVTEDQAAAGDTENAEQPATEETTEQKAEEKTEEKKEETTENESNSGKVSVYDTGKMQVSDAVRLRKGQSTDSEIVDNIYKGDFVNVKEQYASGWAKVEYNGKTGYIKSEFLTKE